MTGWAKVRMVDITAQSYQIARQYMIQLSDEDFKDPVVLGRYATLAGMSLGGVSGQVSATRSNVMDIQS